MKGVSVGLCNSKVNQHVDIYQHPKGQISTSATWPYILVAPWSGSMANLWYTPVSINKIWPYTNSVPPLSNFWPYLTATAATATDTPIYAWQNIVFLYIIISWIKSNAQYISKFAKIATTNQTELFQFNFLCKNFMRKKKNYQGFRFFFDKI